MQWLYIVSIGILALCLLILIISNHNNKKKLDLCNKELESYKIFGRNSNEFNKKLQAQHLVDTQKLQEEFANEKLKLENELNEIRYNAQIEKQSIVDEVNKFIRLQEAINQEYISREERKQNESFYHITLDSDDEHDITLIRTLSVQLYKPEKILTFIFENYYRDKLYNVFKQVLIKENALNKGGIYKITNIKDGKLYIGQAKNINERWQQHVRCAIKNQKDKESCNKLYDAIRKEGIENFKFEVLEIIEDSNELNDKEKFYIEYYKSNVIGYNIKAGG